MTLEYRINSHGNLIAQPQSDNIKIVHDRTSMCLMCDKIAGEWIVTLYASVGEKSLEAFSYDMIDCYMWAFTTMHNRLVDTSTFEMQAVDCVPKDEEAAPLVQLRYANSTIGRPSVNITMVAKHNLYDVVLGSPSLTAEYMQSDVMGPSLLINADHNVDCVVEVRFSTAERGFRLSQREVDLVQCAEVTTWCGFVTQLSDYELFAAIQLMESLKNVLSGNATNTQG